MMNIHGHESSCSPPAVQPLPISGAYQITGRLPGVTAVLFGGIHGDEPAGGKAIEHLLTAIERGELLVERGKVILAIGNEVALKRGVSCERYDLNRSFRGEPLTPAHSYEERRVEELKSILQGAHYLLDLHQTSRPSKPFIMCEEHLLEEAKEMCVGPIVTGWSLLDPLNLSGDTESYFNSIGGKGFTFEAGQQGGAEGETYAVEAALHYLRHAGCVELNTALPAHSPVYKLFASKRFDRDTFRYTREYSTFDILEKDELIGTDNTGEYRAPSPCVIIMPSEVNFLLARTG